MFSRTDLFYSMIEATQNTFALLTHSTLRYIYKLFYNDTYTPYLCYIFIQWNKKHMRNV